MPAIIAEKKIVVRAIDQVTEPLARMNQRLASVEQSLGRLDSKFNAGASSQQSFKASLNELKTSANQTDDALGKINTTIDKLNGEKVTVKPQADTASADEKIDKFKKNTDTLRKNPPKIKPEADTDEATKKLSLFRRGIENTRKAGLRLRDIVSGSVIATGITSISSHLTDWAKQGFEAAKAGTEVAERWKNLGMTEEEVKSTGAAVKELKENSNLSGAAVGNLVTRFYGFTGSAERAQELATGVASLADKMKLSQDQADGFANGLTRIESSGKVTAQSLGRLERSVPGLTKALQQASGMTKEQFDSLLASGDMTADQFNDILAKASKSWDENSKEWNGTVDGALHHMKTSWDDAKKAFMAPLVSSAGSGLGALSKALDRLNPLFTAAGKSVADLSEKFAKWLTPRHVDDIGKIVTALGKMLMVIGKGAWKAFSGIISGLTAPFRLLGSHGKKAGDAFDKLADGMDHLSKNKMAMKVLEGIGMILATQFAYSKLFKIVSALTGISGALGKIRGLKFSGHLFGDLFTNLKRISRIRINPAKWFKGGGNWAKNLFKTAPEEALRSGDKAGGNFITRFAAKTNSSRFAQLGRTTGGRLISGVGLAFEAYDLVKDLHGAFTTHNGTTRSRDIGKAAGAGIGAGIGFFFGGPAGAALGGMIGRVIGGKIGPAGGKFGNGIGKVLNDIFVKHDWNKVWSDIGKGWQSFWKGMGSWWDKTIGKKGSGSSSSHKSKQPSEKEIKSLGGNHYSRTDIANIKEMNRAITTYTRSLKSLKEVVKHNDPTKSLNSMNKNLKNFIKQMLKSEKPLEKVSKTFKNFGKATKTIADSMKNLTGKHGLGEFDKDFTKLDKDTKHSKVGEFFERLAKSIKKSKLTDQFKSLTKYLGSMVKDWEHLVKPMKQAEKEFSSFEKTIGKLANKKTGLSKVDSDIKTLSKDLKKYDFGKELGKQMQTASKQLQGKHSFTKQFDNMTRSIEKSLTTFRKAFQRDWTAMWKNLGKDAQAGLGRAVRTANSEFNSLRSSEHRFESGFLSSWKGWLSDVVSAMRSGFSKLAGITAINAVISDFGGDKQLGTIKYATGTSMAGGSGAGYSAHPGGEAVINDGQGPHKQELVWQPSKGWQLFAGLNRHVWLEPGAQIIPGERSHRILSRMRIPHYAYGNLSREQLDHIEDEFMSSPLDAAKQLMLGVTNWSSKVPLISDFGEATAIGFGHGIANVLKTAVGTVQHAIGGDWGPAISSAARHMWAKISRSFRDELKQVIQNESGGIETRIQDAAVDDINMKNGNPAQGLLQYIPQTFAKYAMPGHGNILAGFDQLMAFFNNSDYLNSIGFSPVLHKIDWLNAGPVGGRRYANGGHITDTQLALVGDNAEHDEYVINPYRDNAIPLLNQAWDKVRMRRPDLTDNQSTATSAELISLVKTAIDKLDNIDIHPRVYIDDVRRPINNRNAMDYSRVMN